jgi:hypothetical protein
MSSKARAIGWLMLLSLLLAGCGQSTPNEGVEASPSAVEVLSGSYDVGYGESGAFDAKAGRADVAAGIASRSPAWASIGATTGCSSSTATAC